MSTVASVPCFVGLDYHQDAVQVCVLDDQGRQLINRSCANDWQAIVRMANSAGRVQRAAIEACGGSADLAEQLATRAGWRVELAHPGYVERMKRSPDKSDYSDGRMLADLIRVGYLPAVWLAPPHVREMRTLVQHRQSLVDAHRNIKLRIRALLREQRQRSKLRPWTAAWLAWAKAAPLSEVGRWVMEQHLADLKALGEKIFQSDQRLHRQTKDDPLVAALLEEESIGPVTAWVIRAYVGRFDRFGSGKQLARYCGLSPCNASSGQKQADAGLIRATNPLLRCTLIEAAHRLVRYPGHWQDLYQRLRAAGKAASLTVAAVANRWTRKLYHRMRTLGDGDGQMLKAVASASDVASAETACAHATATVNAKAKDDVMTPTA
jgi:transposase